MMNSSGSNSFKASPSGEEVAYPSWNPNSTMVAFWALHGQTSEMDIYNLLTNTTTSLPGEGSYVGRSAAAWSPDGSKLAFLSQSSGRVMVYSLLSGTSKAVADCSGASLAASWESDDVLLYTTSGGNYSEIESVSLTTGTIQVVEYGQGDFVSPKVGPNGTFSYYSDLNPGISSDYPQGFGGFNIWVANADGSNATFQYVVSVEHEGGGSTVEIPYIPGTLGVTYDPAWSPDGTQIVYTAYAVGTGYTMYTWDVATWAYTTIGPYGAGMNCMEPSWSPDGASIAFCSNMGGYYHIWLLNVNGAPPTSTMVGYSPFLESPPRF